MFCDTNILLNPNFNYSDYKKIFISIVSIEEMDGLKNNDKVGYLARHAINKIESADNIEIVFNIKSDIFIPYLDHKNDNVILGMVLEKYQNEPDIQFLCDDYGLVIKAKGLGIPCKKFEFENNIDIYKGYKEVILNDEELAEFYQNPENKWDCLINEFLLIRDNKGEIIDKRKWTEKGFKTVGTRPFKSIYFPDFKPRDEYQMFAMDSLVNDDLTLLFGKAGTAKTMLSLSWIMQNIHTGKIGTCIIVFNPAKLKNSESLGFYSGNRTEKLLQNSIGGILSSKFGSMDLVNTLISNNKLMLIPTSDIRGIEISEHDCIYLTEGQNTDAYTMRTIIQRAKEGCKVIIEGDILEQIDIRNNNLKENGMYRTIEVFRGTKYFSCVKLKNIYRSPLADIAQNI